MDKYLDCQTYILTLRCPRCHEAHEVVINLDTRLTVDLDSARLAAKLKSKAVDHICGQMSLLSEARKAEETKYLGGS